MDWVPKESEIKLDKINIDAETQKMLAARFGDDFVGRISQNLEVKTVETHKREKFGNKKRGERKEGRPPRENK